MKSGIEFRTVSLNIKGFRVTAWLLDAWLVGDLGAKERGRNRLVGWLRFVGLRVRLVGDRSDRLPVADRLRLVGEVVGEWSPSESSPS
jgi:hypothetical protein